MIIIVILTILVIFIIKKLLEKHNEKKKLDDKNNSATNDVENYIPKSVMESVFKCPSCGASVPAKTNDHVTMFCSFCGTSLKDAHEVLNTARQDRSEERRHDLELKRFAEKERQQNIELESIKLQRAAHQIEKKRQTHNFILIIFCCILGLFMILGAAGLFKFY